MKRTLTVAFATLAMTAIVLAADNSVGTWKINIEKSKQPSGVSPITTLTVVREAVDGGVKVSAKGERADGSTIENSYTVIYDGKEVPVTGPGTLLWDAVSMRQVNDNTLTEERTKKDGKYHATVRHVVSHGGKIMTSTAKGTGPDGKVFTSLIVFDKQ